LNDVPWDRAFINTLSKVASGEASFEVIPRDLWGYPDFIDHNKARASMAKQQARGSLYAGMESYHHMCRFNSG
jgi:mannosyltransferase